MEQFMEVFIVAHDNYNYDELCGELVKVQKMKDKPFNDFMLRVVKIYYEFHESDKPSSP
jgi:hypothetical protein